MNIDENHSLKDLERLKRKIETNKAKKSTKVDQSALYELIKKDYEKHRRDDGRKFSWRVDYLECYVNGLPPLLKQLSMNLVSEVSVLRLLRKLFQKLRISSLNTLVK